MIHAAEHGSVAGMDSLRTSRTAATALVITVAAVLYSAVVALSGWEPRLGWLFQAVIHVGELLAVLALAWSNAAAGRVFQVAAGVAVLGQAVLAVAELIWPVLPDLGDTLFAVGPLLSGLGLIVAGVMVVRARQWQGWRRFAPLAVGAYVFVALIPVLIGSGGPPAPAAVWTICGWDVLWALTAAAALTGARERDHAHR